MVTISKEAVERLAVKLEQWRGTGQAVDMYEEFRLLTLQVIGKAILSLPPDECDRVGGCMYRLGMRAPPRDVRTGWGCAHWLGMCALLFSTLDRWSTMGRQMR